MRIVELGKYSMTVMKDSEDKFYWSLSRMQKKVEKMRSAFTVAKYKPTNDYSGNVYAESSESICTGGKIMLFFKDELPDFKLGDKVELLY